MAGLQFGRGTRNRQAVVHRCPKSGKELKWLIRNAKKTANHPGFAAGFRSQVERRMKESGERRELAEACAAGWFTE